MILSRKDVLLSFSQMGKQRLGDWNPGPLIQASVKPTLLPSPMGQLLELPHPEGFRPLISMDIESNARMSTRKRCPPPHHTSS